MSKCGNKVHGQLSDLKSEERIRTATLIDVMSSAVYPLSLSLSHSQCRTSLLVPLSASAVSGPRPFSSHFGDTDTEVIPTPGRL